MAFAYARLAEIQFITTTTGVLYTHTTGSIAKSYVRSVVVHNSGTSNEDVRMYVVPDNGGSAGVASTANEFYRETIAAQSTRMIEFAVPGVIMIDNNEVIRGLTTTSGAVTVMIFGGQE
jgi:hypothetical protein